MNIEIQGRHVKVTPALQEHVHSKIDHLDKYFNGVLSIHVILEVETTKAKRTLAELVCNVSHGKPIVARAQHEDMYMAIDGAVHIAREHLKKFKEKKRDRKRNSGRLGAALTQSVASPDEEEAESEE